MERGVAITGIGLVTPLGTRPDEILRRLRAGETAATRPTGFDPSAFSCRLAAEVTGFRPEDAIPDPKMVRLMSRDALLAAAAARLAVEDAHLEVGRDYAGEEIALFGATGLAGMRLEEVAPLVRHAAGPDGGLDLRRFGSDALKRIRPILSFKILSNMPICFVSIFERIQGPNAIYNPWEGQGARAVARGIAAIRRGDVPCALVGACDAKAHELAFTSLEQAGLFLSWKSGGHGIVPGEGAAFLVLEEEGRAERRGAPVKARVLGSVLRTANPASRMAATVQAFLAALAPRPGTALLSAEEGDGACGRAEEEAFASLGLEPGEVLRPKTQAGNLFAAAAPLQVGLAAAVASEAPGRQAFAACLGHGSQKAAFLVEGAHAA